MTKPIVIIESPFAGDVALNTRYARAAVRDSLLRGEAPYASHLLYTQQSILDDEIPEQRRLGMEAGFAFSRVADLVAVYVDLGESPGMDEGVNVHLKAGRRVEFRTISDWPA